VPTHESSSITLAPTPIHAVDGEPICRNSPFSSRSASPTPEVKGRDFAYEPSPELRGYYVPHPPTEARASRERALHTRRIAAKACLPLYPALKAQYDAADPRRQEAMVENILRNSKPRDLVYGTKKRLREDEEYPGEARQWEMNKRARYMTEKFERQEVQPTSREDAAKDAHFAPDYSPQVPEGPPILTPAEYNARLGSRPYIPSSRRGILRKRPTVPVISTQPEVWFGPHLIEMSPKLGPLPIRFSSLGKEVMLGAYYPPNALSIRASDEDMAPLNLAREVTEWARDEIPAMVLDLVPEIRLDDSGPTGTSNLSEVDGIARQSSLPSSAGSSFSTPLGRTRSFWDVLTQPFSGFLTSIPQLLHPEAGGEA